MAKMVTPTKCPQPDRSNATESSSKTLENLDPNLSSPVPKSMSSPLVKSGKSQKSAGKNPNPVFVSPRNKIRERKFVVAKKNNKKKTEGVDLNVNVNCKCKDKMKGKCLCVAYENLRASQEEFFKSRSDVIEENLNVGKDERGKEEKPSTQNSGNRNGYAIDGVESDSFGENCEPEEAESPTGVGNSMIKRRRDRLMEEARESVPEPGSGRVKHLVEAFEKLLTIPNDSEKKDEKEEDTRTGIKWALPGLQQQLLKENESQGSSPFCPGELFFTAESLGLNANVSSSLDSCNGSVSSRSSVGSRKSRRSSSVSSGTVGGRKWKKKQIRATSLRPFKLRTEQRGKMKEEEFFKKLQEMYIEEEKQRIPIAQGLPWTTDEPECLIKPLVKECTKPVDLKLYSDIRAEERAEFDHQVAEKMMMIEQFKMERERQQKLEEEEELKRLRKELVPKAQPMPYFDRPFVPRRSEKNPTIPKEPKFHVPQSKKIKCYQSWDSLNLYTHH